MLYPSWFPKPHHLSHGILHDKSHDYLEKQCKSFIIASIFFTQAFHVTQLTHTTSVDYSLDGLYEQSKKNKLIYKQDSVINPFAQAVPVATDAASSQHPFLLFLNTCSRSMILSAALHISIGLSTFLQTTVPATTSLSPPLHIQLNCVAHRFHKAQFYPPLPQLH